MNLFRYTISELFLLTAYAGLTAACYRYHWIAGTFCLCACLGFESGRKTDYPIFLMLLASQFMAALFMFAIGGISGITLGYDNGAIAIMERGKTIAGNSGALLIFLDITLWLAAIGCLVWFFKAWATVNQEKPTTEPIRKDLEEIIKRQRLAKKSTKL